MGKLKVLPHSVAVLGITYQGCCLGEKHLVGPHVPGQRNKCQITLDKPVKERQPVTGVNHTSLPCWCAPEHAVGWSSRCRKQALVFVPCEWQPDEGEKASTSTCLFKKDTVTFLGQEPSLPQEQVTPERKSWPQTHPLQHLGKKKKNPLWLMKARSSLQLFTTGTSPKPHLQ